MSRLVVASSRNRRSAPALQQHCSSRAQPLQPLPYSRPQAAHIQFTATNLSSATSRTQSQGSPPDQPRLLATACSKPSSHVELRAARPEASQHTLLQLGRQLGWRAVSLQRASAPDRTVAAFCPLPVPRPPPASKPVAPCSLQPHTRDFLQRGLTAFKDQHPHIDVLPEVRRGHHPYIEAEFGELSPCSSPCSGGAALWRQTQQMIGERNAVGARLPKARPRKLLAYPSPPPPPPPQLLTTSRARAAREGRQAPHPRCQPPQLLAQRGAPGAVVGEQQPGQAQEGAHPAHAHCQPAAEHPGALERQHLCGCGRRGGQQRPAAAAAAVMTIRLRLLA